jgi:hypothetical protein
VTQVTVYCLRKLVVTVLWWACLRAMRGCRTGGINTQPPASHGAVAAAPTAQPRPTTALTAADISEDDADGGASPPTEPRAAEEPPAVAAGDPAGDDGNLFVPPLPEDHAAELAAVEEAPPDRPQKDPGADLSGFVPAPVDHLLKAVYGDWPHHNDGCHLDGGVNGDVVWQRRWRRIADLSSTHYSVPKGKVGRRFINILVLEFRGVQARTWNSERPLVLSAKTTPGVKRARDIQMRLTHRMDLWYEGKFIALVDDTKTEVQSRHGSQPVPDEETLARAYNEKVLSGRLRSAVRNLTNRDEGGVLQPDDPCTKTGRPAGPRSLAGQAFVDARPRS